METVATFADVMVVRGPTLLERVRQQVGVMLRKHIPALRECCEHCNDGQGKSIYPMYGVAPHTCFYKISGATVGQSVELPESQWPAYFQLDPEMSTPGGGPRCGIYWKCPLCEHAHC